MTKTVGILLVATLAAAACSTSDDPLQQPRPLQQATPFRYPVRLWDDGVEGETVLMLHVDGGGGVDSVYVENSSGHESMDSSAVTGARSLRFEPARRGDETVAVWVRLPVRFSLDGGANAELIGADSAATVAEPGAQGGGE